MRAFLNLLCLDWALAQRNKIVAISAVVTIIYTLIFRALSGLDQLEKFLVLVILNDPALLGFLFVGVMVLFEKDERTLEALAVTPVRWSHYIWSKTLVLTTIAVFCCCGMVIGGYDCAIHWGHFLLASIFSTVIFSFLGFIVVASHRTFNTYMLWAVLVILLMTLPFLGYFDVLPVWLFVPFPTYYAILLYDLSFATVTSWGEVALAYGGCSFWTVVLYRLGWSRFTQKSILA